MRVSDVRAAPVQSAAAAAEKDVTITPFDAARTLLDASASRGMSLADRMDLYFNGLCGCCFFLWCDLSLTCECRLIAGSAAGAGELHPIQRLAGGLVRFRERGGFACVVLF
jgi:hypothetical protein